MRSKASLFLMEQLVMLLVFALAAALCLNVFARSNEISLQTGRRDEAVIIAQNAAEVLKYTSDPDLAQKTADGTGFTLEIREENSGIDGLRQAKLVVFYENSEVFSLRTGWQEVGQ